MTPFLDENAPRLEESARSVMNMQWNDVYHFTAPNSTVYPWQWLWDSGFHSLIWESLEDPRSVIELETLLSTQLNSGAIPHMTYWGDPDAAVEEWGIAGHSTITQPPLYGFALATLIRNNHPIPLDMTRAVLSAFAYLFRTRMTPTGLLASVHPWETGCDDSLRWEAWEPTPYVKDEWNARKHELVKALRLTNDFAVSSPKFSVCSIGFNALVAWNAMHAALTLHDAHLLTQANALAARIDLQYDEKLRTWIDCSPHGEPGSNIRTIDSLLPVLICGNDDRIDSVFHDVLDPSGYGTPFGPAGAHLGEEHFDPDQYWRGPAWPQLTFLLICAAIEHGREEQAIQLTELLCRGALHSHFAEYWNPITGAGHGATPQSWTALAQVAFRMISTPQHTP